MKPVLIVNPAARGGRLGRELAATRPTIERLVDIWVTGQPGDAERLALEAAHAGAPAVIAMGGDGTLGAVAGGLVAFSGRRPAFGVIGFGTGGDFVRMLPAPCTLSTLLASSPTPLDVGRAHFGGRSRVFLNIASLGIGGLVDRYAERLKVLRGFAFPAATALALVRFRAPRVRLCLDGVDTGEHPTLNVLVANGRFGAGGMCFAPDAELGDGLLEVVVLPPTSLQKALDVVPRLYSVGATTSRYVQSFRAREVVATPVGGDAFLDIDGEPFGSAAVRFEIVPQALALLGRGSLG